MWILVVMFLLAAPAWAEDLGELSANPAGLSGVFSLSGYLVSLVIQSANQMNGTNQANKINQFRPYGAGNPYSPSSPTNPYGRGLWIEGR